MQFSNNQPTWTMTAAWAGNGIIKKAFLSPEIWSQSQGQRFEPGSCLPLLPMFSMVVPSTSIEKPAKSGMIGRRSSRDGSMVKSTCDCWRGPGFGCQHPRGCSQLPATPVPGDPTLPLSSAGSCMHAVSIHTFRDFFLLFFNK